VADRYREYANLALSRLGKAIDPTAHPKLAATVGDLLQKAETERAPLRAYRDKHIAHTDLQAHRGQVTIDRVTYGEVEAVVKTLSSILNAIDLEVERKQTAFTLFTQFGDAKHLVYVLERGEQCQERERKARGW